MKIVITTRRLCQSGGLSIYVTNLAKEIQKGDDEIHVITTHDDNSYCGEMLFFDDDNIFLHQLHHLNKFLRYINLIKLLRTLSPDLIISNYHAPTQFVLPFCKSHAKVVHVVHNDTDDFYRVASINARYVDGWICPTPGVRDNFSRYTQRRCDERITVIPHGVSMSRLFQKKSNHAERMEIVFVGVLYPHKGVLIIPEVIKHLQQSKIPFHLSIIGGGICENDLRSAMKDEIASGLVELCGVVDQEKVYRRLSQAHVFLYPTRIDSFGLVIAEAMMNGAVPVVSHLKGITDALVDHGENGMLVDDIESAEQFAEAIIRLYREPGMWQTLSESARKKAERQFSLETFRINYRNYFQKLLS